MAKNSNNSKSGNYVPRHEREAKVQALLTKDVYSVEEAAELLPQLSLSKFTGTANLSIALQLKDKQANESIRGSVVFPAQFGEEKRVLVFAEGEKEKEAKEAGAAHVGMDELIEKVNKGWMEFDVVIAVPAAMPKIAKLGRVLGPRQLMPNPKTGTVTENIATTVAQYKSGKVDFKMDDSRYIKLPFGKLDMKAADLAANLNAAIEAIQAETRRLGPTVIGRVTVSPSMGPAIAVQI